ncbi:MAG: outer membrane beta-barrel protein [Bacteroidales bacterium]|nr:outer membrane beta-barrel protein [Bacteroidales bacterium]MDY6001766.1 outer membrane beta-barrel protein [Candidatus Cryptobacteroides sp.]
MKKLFSVVLAGLLMLIGTNAFAQYSFGGGYTQFAFVGKDVPKNYDGMPGFYFGANYDVAFSTLEGLTFEPGIYYQHYGKKMNLETKDRSYHLNYFNVPLNLKYSFDAGSVVRIGVFTGPRFNIGFAGNGFSKSRLSVKNFDAQWGLGGTVTFSEAIRLRLGYDFGLHKDLKGNLKDEKVRRNGLSIGVEFIF